MMFPSAWTKTRCCLRASAPRTLRIWRRRPVADASGTRQQRPRVLRSSQANVYIFLLAIMLAPSNQAGGGREHSTKPVLYNLITREGEPIDQQIREHYAPKYELVELRNESSFVEAKLTKGGYPNPVYDQDNREVTGSVRVCFVITTDGRLVDPFIFGLANPVLTGPVLEILKGFRATPARVKGAPAASVETLKFTFGPPPRRRIH
ncbi:MAG: Gram-negative bacterial TonB protein C-terminal [Verrucomicrobiota bacterium]